jgi:HK97 family phage portal protein
MGKIRNTITHAIERVLSSTGESFSTWVNTYSKYRTRKHFLRLYRGIVMTCIAAIAEDVAKYQEVFNKKDGRTGKMIQVPHEFSKVLERPNPRLTSKFDLFVATQSFLELVGNAYWYLSVEERSRKVKEIYLMRPDRVTVATDTKTGDVIGYVYRHDNGTEIPLEVDEVQHIKTFNPENEYYGLGTVEAGIIYIETEEDSSIFQRNFIKNQASPSGILTINGKIEPEQFKKVKAQWKEKTEGLANVGKTLFIRGAEANFTKIGLSLGDLDMEKLKSITEDKILKMFRMPKIILGDTDQSGLGRGNAETADYVFAKRNIDPKQTRIDDAVQNIVRRNYKDETIIVSHVSQIPEDVDRQLAEDTAAVGKWLTVNEVRERKGLPKVDGGDQLYVAFNLTPINEAGTNNSTGKTVKRRVITVAKKDATEAGFFRTLDTAKNKTVKTYVSKLKKDLSAQQEKVVSGLAAYAASVKSGAATDAITKAYEEIMPNEDDEANKSAEWLIPLMLLALSQGSEAALALLNIDEDPNISTAAKNAAEQAAKRVVKEFTQQTVDKLKSEIAAGVNAGEDLAALTKRVNAVYNDAKGWRTDRLSDSESHKGINKGVQLGFEQGGVKHKIWKALGSNPCQFCRAMDGSIIEVRQPFVPKGGTMVGEDGGEMVADYDAIENAHAHANCNCWLFPAD